MTDSPYFFANGGPAYPAPDLGEQDFNQRGAYPGMTLRDYFAAKAMAALITEPPWSAEGSEAVVVRLAAKHTADEAERYATAAYRIANAMLKARGK